MMATGSFNGKIPICAATPVQCDGIGAMIKVSAGYISSEAT